MDLWSSYKSWIIGGAMLLVGILSVFIVVPETDQAVIVRTGEPVRTYNAYSASEDFGQTGAGVHWRIPILERVIWIDKRVLDVDMERQEVLSRDQRRLEVDAYARFRIVDPVLMVRTAGSTARVAEQLQPILNSVLRQRLGTRNFENILSAERSQAMGEVRDGLDREAREYGVQIIDVQIKRADLPAGQPLETAFTRMETARKQESDTIRAQGRKQAQIIRAEAEAQAANTYAEAFNRDPEFYDFYRAMKSYDAVFSEGGKESSIILSPDNEYLRQFRGTRR